MEKFAHSPTLWILNSYFGSSAKSNLQLSVYFWVQFLVNHSGKRITKYPASNRKKEKNNRQKETKNINLKTSLDKCLHIRYLSMYWISDRFGNLT